MTRTLGGGAARESLEDAVRAEGMEETRRRRGEVDGVQQEGKACVYFCLSCKARGEEVELQVHWVVVSGQYLNVGHNEHFNLNAF